MWRVGVWWSALLASSPAPHVLQKVGCDSSNCPSKDIFPAHTSGTRREPRSFCNKWSLKSNTSSSTQRCHGVSKKKTKHKNTFQSGSRGGPIIMTQIENEFGNYGYGDHPRDKVSIFCLSFEFPLLYCRHISVSSNQCSGMRYNKLYH